MTKKDFVRKIAERLEVSHAEADRFMSAFHDALIEGVECGEGLNWPGLFSVAIGHRAARTARNPSTGAPMNIPAGKVVKIKTGSRLKRAVSA